MKKLQKLLIVVLAVLIAVVAFAACKEEEHTHSYTEIGSDETGHWNYCKADNEIEEGSKKAHVDSNYDGLCDSCGYKVGEAHTHSYTALDYDSTSHWYKCPDDGVKDDSTYGRHVDENKDGECDVCKYGMPLPEDEYVGIDLVNEIPTLVVKGAIPDGVGCVKLHYDANDVDHYSENVAVNADSYIFRVPLNSLPTENTPWCFFHLYTYSDANPSDNSAYSDKINLPRGDSIEAGHVYEYGDYTYTIIVLDSAPDMLVIQREPIPQTEVTSIELKVIDNKPYVVVQGTCPKTIPCIKLHADGDSNGVKAHFYGNNVSTEAGKFELRLDMSNFNPENTPWHWFHIYTYTDENPEDLGTYADYVNLNRGSLIDVGVSIECNGILYTVKDNGQLAIEPKVAPKLNTSEIVMEDVTIELDSNGAPIIVAKGVNNSIAKCVLIHANAGDEVKYWENQGKENNLEFRIPATDLTGTTRWWFHIYAYLDAEPTDRSANDAMCDLNRGNTLTIGQSLTYSGVKYTVGAWENVGDGFAIDTEALPTVEVTNIEIKVIDDKPYVIVTGSGASAAACLKIHAEGNKRHYYGDNVSTDENLFELRFDLSSVDASDTPWLFFHVYSYSVAEPTEDSEHEGFNLLRGEYISDDFTLICGDLIYYIVGQDNGQLVVQPKSAPAVTVNEVSIDLSDVPTVVVKGTYPENVACVKIHVKGNGDNDHWYGDDVSSEKGVFECRFELTKIVFDGTPWSYFHIYSYATAEPENSEECDKYIDLVRPDSISVGKIVDYNGVRYSVVNGGSTQLTIQPTSIPNYEVTSIAFEENDNKAYVVIKGEIRIDVPRIVVHADGNGNHYYAENVSTEEGKLEFRMELSQFETEGTPWHWFHFYIYESATADYSDAHQSIDLARNGLIADWASITVDGKKFEITNQGQLCICPSKVD